MGESLEKKKRKEKKKKRVREVVRFVDLYSIYPQPNLSYLFVAHVSNLFSLCQGFFFFGSVCFYDPQCLTSEEIICLLYST